MNFATPLRISGALVLVLVVAAAAVADESVELIRDKWGVAHVFAVGEEALFYGVGFAMAEDRLLQMMLVRSEAEGRLAEILGPGVGDRIIESDKTFRLLGFDRHARKQLEHLQPDTRHHLDAFAAGVNAFANEKPDRLTRIVDLFPRKPRPWTAADCITIWARHAYQFTTGWEYELPSRRRHEQWVKSRKPGETFPDARLNRDDSAAIVTEEEFKRTNRRIYERLKNVGRARDPRTGWFGIQPEGFTASHNWVVSGERSTTGKPILESNPQIPVSFPTTMYEIHFSGGRYDVRGVTFPGTPGIFIGWNRHCAWGATALGGDHADLFEERIDPKDSDSYLYKGESHPFLSRTETINVKGRDPLRLEIRETVHGPVVNALLKDLKEGEVFSLKHTMLSSMSSSLEAQITMMRAGDWASFREGLREFVAPALNLIFADDSGNTAYQSAVSTPKRRALEPLPRIGWTGDDEWEMIPFEEMPSLLNPISHTIFTANHLPVGSWYPYFISTSRGEGPRSWRLRELLNGNHKLSVEEFHETIHLDSTNPGVRDFVKLATLVMREDDKVDPDFQQAISILESWDGRLVTASPAYPFARSVLDVLLQQTTDEHAIFAQYGSEWGQYGGSWNGLNGLLKYMIGKYRTTGQTPTDPKIRGWLQSTLVKAVREATANRMHNPPISHKMPYQNNLGQWGSIAPQFDIVSPPLACPVTQTIWSQAGETFVQIVDLADVDRSLSLLPPGVSEDPASPHAQDQVPLWVAGKMHPAPLTRRAVLSVSESVRHLSWHK